MATNINITIEKGRTGSIVTTVTGVTDWTGLIVELVATKRINRSLQIGDDSDIILKGTINPANNTITFEYTFDDTININVQGYYYEIILFKEDKSYIRNIDYGILTILETILNDPTI
jgi:hypothetical protein